MAKLLREAWFFSRHQLKPLLAIALIYTLPSTLLELTYLGSEEGMPDNQRLLVSGLFICLGVIQFGAAMIYIHHRVNEQPVTVSSAVTQAVGQLLPLLLVNLLMGLAVAGGLMLLVLPGLFLAYKLLFAEFMLLFHGQNPIEALKTSYRSTQGLAAEIVPPLAIWAGLVILVSVGRTMLFGTAAAASGMALLVEEGLSMLLTIYGWALLYRLYQCYIADQLRPSQPPQPPQQEQD